MEAKKRNILFVGNSYTFFNDMPHAAFCEEAKAAGYDVQVTMITKGAHKLCQFADPEYEEGKRLREEINGKHYDCVVLQEQSLTPIRNEEIFLKGVEDVKALMDADKFVLYATWGRNDGAKALEDLNLTREEMTEKLSKAYNKAAKRIGARVAEVGKAFLAYGEAHDKDDLYNADKSHPSELGSKIAAKVILEQVIG